MGRGAASEQKSILGLVRSILVFRKIEVPNFLRCHVMELSDVETANPEPRIPNRDRRPSLNLAIEVRRFRTVLSGWCGHQKFDAGPFRCAVSGLKSKGGSFPTDFAIFAYHGRSELGLARASVAACYFRSSSFAAPSSTAPTQV